MIKNGKHNKSVQKDFLKGLELFMSFLNSVDTKKYFNGNWTLKKLDDYKEKFNSSKPNDIKSRFFVLEIFLTAKHISFVKIGGVGIYQSERKSFIKLLDDMSNNPYHRFIKDGNSVGYKIGLRSGCLVILLRQEIKIGCKCRGSRTIETLSREIKLSEIERIEVKKT